MAKVVEENLDDGGDSDSGRGMIVRRHVAPAVHAEKRCSRIIWHASIT